MSEDHFLHGTIIVVLMNIFIELIGFTYDIFLSKLLGAEALGWFQIAMSTLMVFVVITVSGIPSSLTKLIAQEQSSGNFYNVEKIYKTTILINLSLSIILSTGLIVFSKSITLRVFKNDNMLVGIYALVPAIILVSLANILKSYFYGIQDMITPSLSQIIEHLSRFIIVIGIIYYFSPMKSISKAIIGILGISIGEFFGLIWSIYSKKRLKIGQVHNRNRKWSYKYSFTKVLFSSIPLTISRVFSVVLNFINTILIPSRLIYAGYTSSLAISSFGRITGMAMPLIHLPFVVTSGLVINLIPNLSKKLSLNRQNHIKNHINLAIKATLLVSIPLTILYILLAEPLALFLYDDLIVAEFIRIMGYSTTLLALQHTLSGVLFGLNKQVHTTINRMISMSLRVLLIYVLVGNPKFEIYGFFIAFFITNLLTLILDIFIMKSTIKLNMDYIDIIVKPFVASIFMIGYIKMSTYNLKILRSIGASSFFFTIGIGFFIYIFVLILMKAIPEDFFKRIFRSDI